MEVPKTLNMIVLIMAYIGACLGQIMYVLNLPESSNSSYDALAYTLSATTGIMLVLGVVLVSLLAKYGTFSEGAPKTVFIVFMIIFMLMATTTFGGSLAQVQNLYFNVLDQGTAFRWAHFTAVMSTIIMFSDVIPGGYNGMLTNFLQLRV